MSVVGMNLGGSRPWNAVEGLEPTGGVSNYLVGPEKDWHTGIPQYGRVRVKDVYDSIDLVFSQAAFEHFDDVVRTVEQLSIVCKPGATLVAEIDLKTHSRWIRDKDPNNIYRYSNGVYRAFRFRGIPNRVRPYQYRDIFERHGWVNVCVTPLEQIKGLDNSIFAVNEQFRDARNQLELLSVVICAQMA